MRREFRPAFDDFRAGDHRSRSARGWTLHHSGILVHGFNVVRKSSGHDRAVAFRHIRGDRAGQCAWIYWRADCRRTDRRSARELAVALLKMIPCRRLRPHPEERRYSAPLEREALKARLRQAALRPLVVGTLGAKMRPGDKGVDIVALTDVHERKFWTAIKLVQTTSYT